MKVRTVRTHYYKPNSNELELEKIINNIGYENVLQIIPCYCGHGEYFYTIIYEEEENVD